MPEKVDKMIIPRKFDRRVKLTEVDKEKIKSLHSAGFPIRFIAREFEDKCSRRMIQFVLFPERGKLVAEQFKERRKDGRYYSKENHREAIKGTRRYKKELLKRGLLINP